MYWIVNSTDGFSYSIPKIEEYILPKRKVITGFIGMCSWFNGDTEVEAPKECPQISSGGYGLVQTEDYGYEI